MEFREQLILQAFSHFTQPQLILILQAFRHFTYVTAHSPTLPSLYLRYNSFSNPSVASPTSQLILQPFFHLSYVTGFSLTSPGEPPMCTMLLLGDKGGDDDDEWTPGPVEHEEVKKNLHLSDTRYRTRAAQPVAKRLAT